MYSRLGYIDTPSLHLHLFGIVPTEIQSDCWASFLTNMEGFMDMLQFLHFQRMQNGSCAHGALMEVHVWSKRYMFSAQILYLHLKETALMNDVINGEIAGLKLPPDLFIKPVVFYSICQNAMKEDLIGFFHI